MVGFGLDVMETREDSERLLGETVELDEAEIRVEFPNARIVRNIRQNATEVIDLTRQSRYDGKPMS